MAKKATNRKPQQKKGSDPKDNASGAPSSPEKRDPWGGLTPLDIPESKLPPGIRRLIWVDAHDIVNHVHPKNWKNHTRRQKEALLASINENGWAGALLFNTSTGYLIDGHGRLDPDVISQLDHGTHVPVLVGDFTHAQELNLVLTFDPIAAMSETDSQKLKELNDEVRKINEKREGLQQEQKEVLARLHKDLDDQVKAVDYGAPAAFFPASEEWQPQTEEDQSEPSTLPGLEAADDYARGPVRLKALHEVMWDEWTPYNIFDIPNLRPDRMLEFPENVDITTWAGPETETAPGRRHLYIWGSAALEKTITQDLIVSFYTQDYKFESLWNAPEKWTQRMLNVGIGGCVTPNYSTGDFMHFAWDIWNTYRSRWMGRYFQEAGIPIIPDICLGNLDRDEVWKWRLAGIPKDLSTISVEMQSKGETDRSKAEYYYNICKEYLMRVIEELNPRTVLMYTPPDLPKNYLRNIQARVRVIRCKTFMSERSKVIKSKEVLSKRSVSHAD